MLTCWSTGEESDGCEAHASGHPLEEGGAHAGDLGQTRGRELGEFSHLRSRHRGEVRSAGADAKEMDG